MAVQHPQSEARIANMFDRIAPRYDLLNRLLSARQDQRWRKHLVGLIPYRPNGRYLDVATGTGDVLFAAQKSRTEYSEFLGVDISRQMLRLAEKKSGELSKNNKARFELMSAESLQLPDASYDCASISFGLRNVVDKKKAISEFNRVLKPQGSLLILEFFLPREGLLGFLFQFYFHQVLPRIGAMLSDAQAYKYLPESVGSFYSANELRDVLNTAGFSVEVAKSFLFGSCRLVRAVKVN